MSAESESVLSNTKEMKRLMWSFDGITGKRANCECGDCSSLERPSKELNSQLYSVLKIQLT